MEDGYILYDAWIEVANGVDKFIFRKFDPLAFSRDRLWWDPASYHPSISSPSFIPFLILYYSCTIIIAYVATIETVYSIVLYCILFLYSKSNTRIHFLLPTSTQYLSAGFEQPGIDSTDQDLQTTTNGIGSALSDW